MQCDICAGNKKIFIAWCNKDRLGIALQVHYILAEVQCSAAVRNAAYLCVMCF